MGRSCHADPSFGGEVVDPLNAATGKRDVWIEDGHIVDKPQSRRADKTYDVSGCIVMAGAIDIHSHIGGGNVNTARLLLPEQHPAHMKRPLNTPLSNAGWSTFSTGCLYARMGFTTVVEPAMSPTSALHTHLELADIPIIDKATLVILGNDDFLLSMIRDKASTDMIDDYVAWTVGASRSLGVKVINAGAAAAFKENVRAFSFDDIVPAYGVSSRRIVKTLQESVGRLGIPHPLHVHANNLGIAGSAATAAETIRSTEGQPLHLAHLQFYGYGTEGRRQFSSEAARLAEQVNGNPDVTIDIGQVMFGQTVTISSDVTRQYSGMKNASPRKSVIIDGDGNGGGIVPYRYRKDYYGSLQWAVGLELFLLINDPWRVFFTTDHPNGAPFTAYPDLFELLMSRDVRNAKAAELDQSALELTTLASIYREYTLDEVAIMTRCAPARLLGLSDRGHLGAGAIADVAVYRKSPDIAKMFRDAALVFKNGDLVVEDGVVTHYRWGRALRLNPPPDRGIVKRMQAYHEDRYGLSLDWFTFADSAIARENPFAEVACRS
ncbi:formylmethanofuran dehydrogenase subunit A [Sinorhizobium sp. BG8]|uniref:formylmethanofuran dehydrogenase subunit A n=1 Tax=Sinorhizobium sp. BG8 TaxID=2613773 RepID=UPI001FED89FE|nr:formylmethanofuran dehydrogenase subunit A [Sinorhizobium sp. BG8]